MPLDPCYNTKLYDIYPGESLIIQLSWVYELNGVGVPFTGPVSSELRDYNQRMVLRFSSENDPTHEAYATWSSNTALVQLSAPAEVTKKIPLGNFASDVWVYTADYGSWPDPIRPTLMCQGHVQVKPISTKTV